MRDADAATELARELDTALGATLRVLRVIQYGGRAEPDELRRIVDMGDRVRNQAAWISDGRIGRDDRAGPELFDDASRPRERRS